PPIIPGKERDMPSRTLVPAFITTLIVTASAASAQSAAPLLVDAEWLSQHLTDGDLVVLHVGDDGEYRREHIPGARLITEEDVSKPHNHSNMKDMMLELPDAPTLRAGVSRFGISDNSRVVVYFGGEGLVQSATRIVFTLDYLGLGARTCLLNGGLAAWKRAGKAVTGVVPPAARGNLATATHEALVVDAVFVSSVPSRQGDQLIDAPAPVFSQCMQP